MELLVSAAKQTELRDPYVRILSLGDVTVVYQVSGFLAEPKTLLTCQSRLNAKVLDTLHGAGIEIMSPNFARHISHASDRQMIPVNVRREEAGKTKASAEDVAFAKANQAEAEQVKKAELREAIAEVKTALDEAEGESADQLKENLTKLQSQLESLQNPDQAED